MTETTQPIRVMVVDDSAVVRGLWARRIDVEPDMRVVAAAWTGQAALDVLRRKEVDVVLLDIEMPEMDGMTALPLILEQHPGTRVIMASTLTQRGAEVTIRALSLGAADYVAKPRASGAGADMEAIGGDLIWKIRALGRRKLRAQAPTAQGPALRSSSPQASPAATCEAKPWVPPLRPKGLPPRAIAITSSTGGPNALSRVLSALPADFPLPIVIVQHMPPVFTDLLAQRLERTSGRPCSEAQEGEEILDGHTYVAPGGKHLEVRETHGRVTMHLTEEPPVNFCRPSADRLFRTMAQAYGSALVAVVLTGMGRDGRDGAQAIADAGGRIVAQDESSSVVWGMPGAVVEAGIADEILPLDEIAATVNQQAQAPR